MVITSISMWVHSKILLCLDVTVGSGFHLANTTVLGRLESLGMSKNQKSPWESHSQTSLSYCFIISFWIIFFRLLCFCAIQGHSVGMGRGVRVLSSKIGWKRLSGMGQKWPPWHGSASLFGSCGKGSMPWKLWGVPPITAVSPDGMKSQGPRLCHFSWYWVFGSDWTAVRR